jgi:hypothetical protein
MGWYSGIVLSQGAAYCAPKKPVWSQKGQSKSTLAK